MNSTFYLDTSGSMSDDQIQEFFGEMREVFKQDRIRRQAFLKWQRRVKPERARNRMRRESRRQNRK